MRLYRHALESIFGFLSLAELSPVLVVSRSWCVAVGSMRFIDAAIYKLRAARPLVELCASQLACHIGTLGSEYNLIALSQEGLYLLGFRMSGLHSLHYRLPSPLAGPLIFPPSLTELTIRPSDNASAQEVDLAMAAIGRLSKLATLRLWSADETVWTFAALRRSTQLQKLACSWDGALTPEQADDLRAIPNLTHLDAVVNAAEIRLLLRAPHQLRWTKLTTTRHLDAESAGLLASLPSLTKLSVYVERDVAFLNSTPNLRTLGLFNFARGRAIAIPSPEHMIAGLGLRSQLTQLSIWDCKLTAAHVGALLSRMPALTQLKLHKLRLESLSFLSSPPLARTLIDLTLSKCRHAQLRASELHHLFSLQQLTDLDIRDCFSERLDSLTLREFEVPSVRLPKLVRSFVVCSRPDL